MSLSPESFDRLLADKLAQMPAPAYDPAHWDMLEDQLQHLTQAAQQAPQGSPATGSTPAPVPASVGGGWLAGSVAKLAVVATLAGVTAVNGYLYLANQARPVPRDEVMIPTTGVTDPRVTNPEAASPAVITATEAPQPVVVPQPLPRIPPLANEPAATRKPVATDADMPSAPIVSETAIAAPAPSAVAVTPPMPTAAEESPATVPPIASDAPLATTTPAPASNPTLDAERMTPTASEANNLSQLSWVNIIVPNGDGLNDRLELPLPAGTCRLTVFDRSGKVVYVNDRYDNSWDASGYPAGTYNYLVETSGPTAARIVRSLTVIR